jgi:hypothetical protein
VTLMTRQHRHTVALEEAGAEVWPLPPPLLPSTLVDYDGSWCADGPALQHHVVDSPGFQFTDEGSAQCAACHKYGYVATTAGSSLTVKVNSDLPHDPRINDNSTVVGGSVSLLKSYTQMGHALFECRSGCRCDPRVIDARHEYRTSELVFESFHVTPAPECMVKFTVLNETSTGGHKFRVSANVVHKAKKLSEMHL